MEFPAAFRETVSVSALGKTEWCPEGTAGWAWIPLRTNRFGRRGLYLAAFSAFGSKIDCAGPGNAILSTVPERFGLKAPYASMEGTSMASAAVTGALAVALSKSREYLASPRVRARAVLAGRFCVRGAGMSALARGFRELAYRGFAESQLSKEELVPGVPANRCKTRKHLQVVHQRFARVRRLLEELQCGLDLAQPKTDDRARHIRHIARLAGGLHFRQ